MEATMALLEQDEIDRRLADLSGWSLSGDAIVKDFERGDFAGSVELVNEIAPVADELNHHPDLAISWDTVTVTITTHSQGGLTAADFELAGRIEALA
jgi:4a-hydroxytetrahydrobiopterin dehydratase